MDINMSRKAQPTNPNFLYEANFQLVFDKIPSLGYFCKRVNIPGTTIGVAIQDTAYKDVNLPGSSIQQEDFQEE